MRIWLIERCGRIQRPFFLYMWKGLKMLKIKICKVITGVPVLPIMVGSPAMLYHNGHVTKTTEVLDVCQKSDTEIRFETRHTLYILKIDATSCKEVASRYGWTRSAYN